MQNINEIIISLKQEINDLKSDDIPKFIFIGGLPGSGKSLMIEKVKQDFSDSDFSVIEADMYRHYFNDKKTVEETVELVNEIEGQLLEYSLEHKKNIISISTLRSYEYINNLIREKILKSGYKIYFYIIITNVVESSLSTYDRYIDDKKNKKPFPRLNRLDYLKLVNDGFLASIKLFSTNEYFNKVKFFIRGKDLNLPVEVKIKNFPEDISKELSKQIEMTNQTNLNDRINRIRTQLNENFEKEEFDKVINWLIKD